MPDQTSIRSHKDLDVWHAAMSLAERLYRETAVFPREEIYGMTAQMRRAGVSIPANIAEGYGRSQTGQFAQFIRIMHCHCFGTNSFQCQFNLCFPCLRFRFL